MTTTRDEALDAAIAQHPQLWEAMKDAHRLKRDHGGWDPWANGQALGFVRSLCIVGGFDTCVVERRLEAETAPA